MPHPPCSTPRPLPSVVLDQIARQLAADHRSTPHALLVRARPGPTGVDIGLCALPEGVHPAEALVGHVVPPSWTASGVVAPARARSFAGATAAGPGTPATVVVLAGRDSYVTSHVDGVEAGAEPPVGRLPDLLLRTLGRATAPPGVPAAEWWRAVWLDALVAAAAADPSEVPHPDRPLTSTLPTVLVQALVDEPELCAEEGWRRLRRLAALAEPPERPGPAAVRATMTPFVDPPTAAWLDDGSFARALLSALPAVDELLDLAAALVPPSTLALLREVSGRTRSRAPVPPEGEPAPRAARGGAGPPR